MSSDLSLIFSIESSLEKIIGIAITIKNIKSLKCLKKDKPLFVKMFNTINPAIILKYENTLVRHNLMNALELKVSDLLLRK